MPSTYHELCTWHISRNALKNLTGKKKGKNDEADMKVSGKEILKEFRACMYDYSDVDEFEYAFESLLCKVHEVEAMKKWPRGRWLAERGPAILLKRLSLTLKMRSVMRKMKNV